MEHITQRLLHVGPQLVNVDDPLLGRRLVLVSVLPALPGDLLAGTGGAPPARGRAAAAGAARGGAPLAGRVVRGGLVSRGRAGRAGRTAEARERGGRRADDVQRRLGGRLLRR